MAIDYTKLSDSDLRAIAANNVSALSDEALRMIAGQSAAVSKPVSAPSTERSWGDVAKDIPAGVLSGVGSLLQVPGQLVGLVPGMKGVGEALEAPGEAVQKFGTDLKSAGLKAREALRSQSISEAAKDGILSEFATAITSTLKDPALITSFITEQAPLLIGPLGAARLTAKLGMGGVEAAGAAAAKGLTGEAAEIASQKAMDVAAKQLGKRATTAAIGTGAAMEAGDTSSETYKRTLNRALEMNMSREEAEAAAIKAARIAALGAGAVSLGANIGLSKLGGDAIERALAGLPGKGRVQGAFGEATSETLEGSGAQVFQNIGVRTVDPNQSLTEGVGAAAGLSALGGGFFGGMLSKKPDAALAPGQRPGESLYETAARLNREIKNIEDLAKLGETDQGRTDSGLLTNMQLVDMYREQGYGAVRQYQQQLVDRANDPTTPPEQKVAAQQAAKEVQDLFKQVTQEEVSRQMPLETQYTITASDLTKLDIKGSDPLYKAALGKDIRDPVQVQEIQDAIDAELNRKGIRQTQAARILFFKDALDRVIAETLPAGGLRAATTVEPSGGDGAGVAGVSAAQPATGGVGAAKPSRVVPAEPAIEEPTGGKAEPTTPVMEDDITPQKVEKVWQTQPNFVFADYPIDTEILRLRLIKKIGDRQGVESDIEGMASDALKASGRLQEVFEEVPSPAKPQEAAPPAAPAATVTTSVSSLPKDLAGAKPRYSYGNKQFQLQFNSDIDKALYITAQKTPSRRDADYRAWLGKQGFTPEQITQEGQRVREAIKGVAAKADPAAGPINLPEQVKKPTVKKSLAPEVKDKLEPIYKRLEQRVKTAKPEAKPEAKAEEAQAPKEKTQKEALMERRAELIKELDGILKKILAKYNLTGVTLNLEEGMAEEGSYSGQIIKLALNLENPVRVLRHESIHALKDMGFFSDAQWKTLVKRAQDEWVQKYLKDREHNATQSRYDAYVELLTKEGLNPTEVQEAIIEEAIADAFGDFDVNGAPPGLMAAIHRRMTNLFKAIKEAFGRAGIDTAEEIFGKIEKGSLKPAIPMGKEQAPKMSLRGVPFSTRALMEAEDNAARAELGLNTEAKRGRYNNVRDVARALNDDTLKNHGAMNRKQLTEDDAVKIADAIADEVSYQLGTTAETGTGLGWYSNNYPRAVKRLQKRFPELADNQHARSVFSAIVAVTSNGEKVTKNISNAVELYSKIRQGKPMVAMGNRRATALVNNLRNIEKLLQDHGTNFEKHLLEEITVKDMNARLRELGQKTDGSYLADTVVPRAAIYFGPKLGAFYANLSGSEGYLTMDLWWTRSINRMRGLLIPKATDASIDKFRDMMGQPEADRDEVAAAAIPLRNKYEEYGFTTELEYLAGGKEPSTKAAKPAWFKRAEEAAGDAYEQLLFDHNLEKMANTIYKNEYEMLEEAPFTASDRAFMYKAARIAQNKLRKEGIDLTLADIQAALWYYEKRLYGKLTGVKANDIGYEEAIIAQASEGDGRARPSVVFGRGTDGGPDAGREVRGAEEAGREPPDSEKVEKKSLRSQTPEFKFWFGQSKIVDKDGKPKVMYHGTARDITEFRGKQAGAIFLTDDPEVSTGYSQESATWMADHVDEFLTPKQIADSIKAAKKEMRENGYRPDQIAALEKDKGILKTDEFRNAVSVYMPSAPNIVPLFVKAEYTFDFENPEHVKAVVNLVPGLKADDFKRTNNWTTVEKPEVQEVLRAMGFDSFYVNEHGKKNLAVYSPTQVVSATGNVGAYGQRPITAEEAARFDMTEEQAAEAQKRGDIRFSLRSPIGLYSELENKVEAVSSKAAPAGQWKTMIAAMTQKGVKPEEIEWSGVNDWLDLQTGKVSKDDLLEYLRANGVQVEETVLGGRESWRQELDLLENRGRINLNAQERERYDELMDRRREEGLPDDEAPSKYQDYTLPGGENYREVLLTLPFQGGARVQKLLDEERYLVQPPERQRKIDAIKEAANVQYISRHWTQPNVLAHIRVNDRTDADGNKVLFVEEIQSDWGQAGKKQGFVSKGKMPKGWSVHQDSKTGEWYVIDNTNTQVGLYGKTKEEAIENAVGPSTLGIRSAPFVTKTEGWLNLALKRIMIMAAEGGYDKVAFVNGEQSADRYNLSKQIDGIGYTKNDDGTIDITVYRNGSTLLDNTMQTPDQVEELIGKELTRKIVDSPRRTDAIEGLDLKIGGEGMKTFYDKIVPTAVKKLLPKVGGSEIEIVEIPDPKGTGRTMDVRNFLGEWETIKIADEPALQQQGFDVTPAMKEKVATTGLPKFSLRSTLPASAINAMDRIAPPRYNPGYAEKIMSIFTGDTFTSIRQKFINRYERLAEYDRRVAKQLRQMGGAAQMAESKAETAALFSDLGAGVLEAAMGVHDRVGGAPIFRNGVTTVSNFGGTVKGLLEIFRPISDSKDPDMFRMYQTWAAVKRGKRLTVEGREDLIDAADIRAIDNLTRTNRDMIRTFEAVQKDWQAYNNALVKYQVDTGVISPAMAREWTKHGDYFPFYRLMDGDDIAGPKTFSSIGNVRPPKKLKGGEDPLGDFFENIVRNSQAAIQAGMKNVAAQRATEQAMRLGEVSRLTTKQSGVEVYRVYENGKEVYYKSHDPLFIEAIKALNMADIPFMGLLAQPASMLRNLVTKDPAFMLANMMRDSLSAWATTGIKMTPVFDTLNNFSKAIAGKSPELDMLYSAGILGGYDYALGSKEAAREFETQLRRRSGKLTPFEIGTKPFTSLWGALEKGTQASDAATRIEVYKKTLAATGNEAEALAAALEVMNFNRKGNNPMIRVLTAAVPFLNARIQGLDVLFRTAIMPLGGTATEQAQQRMKTFWVRGMTMLFLSSAYWLLTHDDDEYKKQEQETRDNNWLIPSLGIKIPIPFEVGVMFKVIPERIMALSFGTDTSKDFTDSMKRQFVSTFAFNPIPQLVLPAYEVKTNHSFFTDRPIIGKGLENVAPQYQIGPSTSRVAQIIGDSLGFSPMKTDHLIKGYTGTIGTYASDLFDMIYDMGAESPKASKRFEQMPVIKRFALDPEARGTVTAYYKLKDEVDQAVRTANLLERSNNFEEGTKYTLDNLRLLATDDYVKDVEKSMKDYREMKQQIMSAPYSADTKRDLLKSIGKMESLTTANIQNIKKFAQ